MMYGKFRMDTPWDRGADSCTRRSAQLLGVVALVVGVSVSVVRKLVRR